MASLTDRAERALLGAMITSPDLTARLGYLQPGDFTDPRRQAAFTGLARAASHPGTGTRRRREAIAAASGHEVTTWYLEELQAGCPDAGHGAAYGAMVVQACLARQMAVRARELAAHSAILGRDARRAAAAGAAGGPAAEGMAGHLAQVAAALGKHAGRLGAAPDRLAPGPAAIGDSQEAPAREPAAGQQRCEERVLAALLREHGQSGQVLSFLPVSAFTSRPRQEVFQAIRALHAAGKPIDELTTDWELAQRAVAHPGTGETYTTRLASAASGREPLLSDASTLLTRLQRRTAPAWPAAAGQHRQASPATPLTQGRSPQPQPAQPPPGAIPAQPGPRHRK